MQGTDVRRYFLLPQAKMYLLLPKMYTTWRDDSMWLLDHVGKKPAGIPVQPAQARTAVSRGKKGKVGSCRTTLALDRDSWQQVGVGGPPCAVVPPESGKPGCGVAHLRGSRHNPVQTGAMVGMVVRMLLLARKFRAALGGGCTKHVLYSCMNVRLARHGGKLREFWANESSKVEVHFSTSCLGAWAGEEVGHANQCCLEIMWQLAFL